MSDRKQELLDQIAEKIDEVKRLIDVGFEHVTSNQNENIAQCYAELGNEEEAINYFLRSLDVLKLTPLDQRETPHWYYNYMNIFGTMCAYAENVPKLKEVAQTKAPEAIVEFDYNLGAVTSWVSHGRNNGLLSDEEAMQVAAKALDTLNLADHEEKYGILNSLQELYGPIYDCGDSVLKDKCLVLMRACAEGQDWKKDLEDWLESQYP